MRVSSGVNLGLGVLPTAVNPLDFSRFDADALGDTLTVTTASLGMNGDLIQVTGYDEEENPIWGGDLLDELADYIVTIPENTAPAYVVAGVG